MSLPTSSLLGYQQLSVTTAASLPSVPAAATYAEISPVTNGVRWRADGTDPTAAIGMPVAAGGTYTLKCALSSVRLISQVGTAEVNIAYFQARMP